MLIRNLFLGGMLIGSLLALAACGSSSKKGSAAPALAPTTAALAASATAAPTVAAAASAAAAAALAATPATNPVERLSGTVASVSGNTVTLRDGGSFMLSPQTAITRRTQSTVAALQTGRVVAVTAKRQADNTLLASLITVFPTAPNAIPLGQRPLDQGNLMTNATIQKVSGNSFTVSFPGGGAQVTLAPGAQITVLASGSAADITSGASIMASVKGGIAQSVGIQ